MAKTRVNFNKAKKDIEKFKKQAKSELKDKLKEEIISSIERGVSPVQGSGRFVVYSNSYQDAIKSGRYSNKKTRPVNLKLTGRLLESIFVKLTVKGVKVGFDNKLADIHNRKGAGKSKTVRRMLPTNDGEKFSRSITIRLREVLDRVANKIFKKG